MQKDVLEIRDRRYTILHAGGAYVEFGYPGPTGRKLRLPLLNMSVGGLSFALDKELPLIVRGAVLADVIVCVGDCRMQGKLAVKHVTVQDPNDIVCGAVFHPATEADLLKLNGLISGMAIST